MGVIQIIWDYLAMNLIQWTIMVAVILFIDSSWSYFHDNTQIVATDGLFDVAGDTALEEDCRDKKHFSMILPAKAITVNRRSTSAIEKTKTTLKKAIHKLDLRDTGHYPKTSQKEPQRWTINRASIPHDCVPLVCFVNGKSGGQQGRYIKSQLIRLLSSHQVFDVSDVDPAVVLAEFAKLSRFKILVCGGDGTIGWILNAVQDIKLKEITQASVAVLPLGTGNDLALELGWGHCFETNSISGFLDEVEKAQMVPIDRWDLVIEEKVQKDDATMLSHVSDCGVWRFRSDGTMQPEQAQEFAKDIDTPTALSPLSNPDMASHGHNEDGTRTPAGVAVSPVQSPIGNSNCDQKQAHRSRTLSMMLSEALSMPILAAYQQHQKSPRQVVKRFQNYLGIGLDAQIVNQFHEMRKARPALFIHNWINKIIYGYFGLQNFWNQDFVGFPHCVNLLCDGEEVILPEDTQGIVFVNIGSYGGGSRLWHDEYRTTSAAATASSAHPHATNAAEKDQLPASVPASSAPSASAPQLARGGAINTAHDSSRGGQHTSSRDRRASSDSESGSASHSDSGSDGRHGWAPLSSSDGLLEVVAIRGTFELATVKVLGKKNVHKLAQGRQFEIDFNPTPRHPHSMPVQCDGEPWLQVPSKLLVRATTPQQQVMMLRPYPREIDRIVVDVLEWAQCEGVITAKQHMRIMDEYTRRALTPPAAADDDDMMREVAESIFQ